MTAGCASVLFALTMTACCLSAGDSQQGPNGTEPKVTGLGHLRCVRLVLLNIAMSASEILGRKLRHVD